jgi:hypothetical protein
MRKNKGPLKSPLIGWMLQDERRLDVLGKLFSRYNMSLYKYLKGLKRKGKL